MIRIYPSKVFDYKLRKTIIAIFASLFFFMQRGDAQVRASTKLPLQTKYYLDKELKASAADRAILEKYRAQMIKENATFNIGITGVFNKPEKTNAGKEFPTSSDPKEVKEHLAKKKANKIKIDPRSMPKSNCFAAQKAYDGRTSKYPVRTIRSIFPLKNLDINDWTFIATGAYELSYLNVNGGAASAINCSEQHLINCIRHGWGPSPSPARTFDWMVDENKNLEKESVKPYVGVYEACVDFFGSVKTDYYAADWGTVSDDPYKISGVTEIKEAICKYGSVCSYVRATSLFYGYTVGVFSEEREFPKYSYEVGYVDFRPVLILGWDDSKSAWLIKPFLGTDWGEDGYMWISYNSNEIGYWSCWVLAKKAQ